jgi:hypothetical protein
LKPACPPPLLPRAHGQVALGPVDLDSGPDLTALARYSRLARLELHQPRQQLEAQAIVVQRTDEGLEVDLCGHVPPAVASRRLQAVLDGFVRPPPPPG